MILRKECIEHRFVFSEEILGATSGHICIVESWIVSPMLRPCTPLTRTAVVLFTSMFLHPPVEVCYGTKPFMKCEREGCTILSGLVSDVLCEMKQESCLTVDTRTESCPGVLQYMSSRGTNYLKRSEIKTLFLDKLHQVSSPAAPNCVIPVMNLWSGAAQLRLHPPV